MLEQQPSTPGGQRLRELRLEQERTQLWVELEAELGTGYLQRLESGRVRQPERATLERILDALDASYNARTELMRLFGYIVVTVPPNEAEVRWARRLAQPQVDGFPYPAYALDCLHRLVAWNSGLPWLLGVRPDDPCIQDLEGQSMLQLWFDRRSGLGQLVSDPDVLLPALIRAYQYERKRFPAAVWAEELLDSLCQSPRFQRYLDLVAAEPPPVSAARAQVALRLMTPNAGELRFRLSSETFLRDARFRIVFYFPDDLVTMRAARQTSEISAESYADLT